MYNRLKVEVVKLEGHALSGFQNRPASAQCFLFGVEKEWRLSGESSVELKLVVIEMYCQVVSFVIQKCTNV